MTIVQRNELTLSPSDLVLSETSSWKVWCESVRWDIFNPLYVNLLFGLTSVFSIAFFTTLTFANDVSPRFRLSNLFSFSLSKKYIAKEWFALKQNEERQAVVQFTNQSTYFPFESWFVKIIDDISFIGEILAFKKNEFLSEVESFDNMNNVVW